jgi:hypothetical protein
MLLIKKKIENEDIPSIVIRLVENEEKKTMIIKDKERA